MQKQFEDKLKEIDAHKNDDPKPSEKPLKIDLSLEQLAELIVQEKEKRHHLSDYLAVDPSDS